MIEVKFDCCYFKGDKPCRFKRFCSSCPNYTPVEDKILIIKLAAIGDVLRTTSILSGLKRKYPKSHITWLVNKEAQALLEGNLAIDRILTFDLDSCLCLLVENFDLLLSFDKDSGAVSLATLVKAKEKKGFAFHEKGYLFPLNKGSEYALRLGIDDSLKFKQNKKTYQELIYEMSGLHYKDDEYSLPLPEESRRFCAYFLQKNKIKKGDLVIGLNTGSGPVFATKKWTIPGFIKLAKMLKSRTKARVLLLGGPDEIERNQEIKSRLKTAVIDTGCHNSLKEFMGIVNCCSLVVSGDTLAMQIAIALKKQIVALFGPTCPEEIDLYGRGVKIVSPVSCGPCYRQACDNIKCMLAITPERVFSAVQRLISK